MRPGATNRRKDGGSGRIGLSPARGWAVSFVVVETVSPAVELTTVGPDEVVVHLGTEVRRYEGLAPDTTHDLDGLVVPTLPRPPGELLATVATVNDVHFGEVECGVVEGTDIGPTFRSPEGAEPYPEVMNRGAVAEMAAIDPAAVVVKGDLTSTGAPAEYDAFLAVYRDAFGDRLHHVQGNHESFHGRDFTPHAPFAVTLPGVRLAVLDTAIPHAPSGRVGADQLAWLDDLAATSDRPVLVFGHHQPWNPDAETRPDDYFGIHPDDSERLVEVVARRRAIAGYFASHTHRNRVRRFSATGPVPWVEVACVKDYPGTWAEYRVYEGGIVQLHRRISTPEALAWSEKTRAMYDGGYADYAFGDLAERCFVLPSRQ